MTMKLNLYNLVPGRLNKLHLMLIKRCSKDIKIRFISSLVLNPTQNSFQLAILLNSLTEPTTKSCMMSLQMRTLLNISLLSSMFHFQTATRFQLFSPLLFQTDKDKSALELTPPSQLATIPAHLPVQLEEIHAGKMILVPT